MKPKDTYKKTKNNDHKARRAQLQTVGGRHKVPDELAARSVGSGVRNGENTEAASQAGTDQRGNRRNDGSESSLPTSQCRHMELPA